MKKPEEQCDYIKLKNRQAAKAAAVEAALEARTTRAMKAITIGSAALGIISLSLFAASKMKKKKGLFS